MRKQLFAALAMVTLLPAHTHAFFGSSRGHEESVLDFTRKAPHEASALAMKLGQNILQEIKTATGDDRHQLIVTLIVCEPFIASLYELLSGTERSLFNDAHVRYGTGSLAGELKYLLTKISEIKSQLPEREREVLHEIQSQQFAMQNYPGAMHPQNPTFAKLIDKGPAILIISGVSAVAFGMLAAVRNHSKAKARGTTAWIEASMKDLEEKTQRKLTELNYTIESQNATQTEIQEGLKSIAGLLEEARSYGGSQNQHVGQAIQMLQAITSSITNLKDDLGAEEKSGGLFGFGRKRSFSGGRKVGARTSTRVPSLNLGRTSSMYESGARTERAPRAGDDQYSLNLLASDSDDEAPVSRGRAQSQSQAENLALMGQSASSGLGTHTQRQASGWSLRRIFSPHGRASSKRALVDPESATQVVSPQSSGNTSGRTTGHASDEEE